MFTIEAKFEDTKINASSDDGKEYVCQFEDAHSGAIANTVTLTAEQLSFVLQINLHPDGEPEGVDKMYESLNPIFEGWEPHLRPIP